ncbi:hypothetical protein E2C01_062278 [Portunus trituberculatus]|uniref:Uncharacterized protein n=1 Tax=Portunus trituberculatus TaxID=210409 RepID=A0A5B7HDL7_PORTR|nr:hypothetical protein [Portunus trituberculatus]
MIHDSRGLTPSRIPEVNVAWQDYGKGVLGLVLPSCREPAKRLRKPDGKRCALVITERHLTGSLAHIFLGIYKCDSAARKTNERNMVEK